MEFIKEDETLDDLELNGIMVIQKKKAFRFGVDAVLLANYARITKGMRVIDLCTGTGIVPFILAGKTEAANITGIEIQENMVEMAGRTVKYNKLEERVGFYSEDLRNISFLKKLPKADAVTVNPPYKLANSGLINPDSAEAIARHEICCTLEDVIIAGIHVLKDGGRLYMVHRPERLADIFCTMRKHRLEPKSVRLVYPSVGKAPNIVLVEGQKYGGAFLKWEPSLYIHEKDGGYTEEINKIYGRK
jgi:tRNA1(Val) A37 N6-methylase TrmN6